MTVDKHSDTWKAVETWAKAKLEEHQRGLEEFGLDAATTEGHRYVIYELKALLKISDQSKNAPSPES